MKVAIVHDWLVGGGAELVVLELHRMYPDAPIYTSYCTDEWRKRLDDKVVTGYLQHWPFSRLRKFLPVLRQPWFRHLNLSGYDLVISSCGNGEAKFIRTPKDAKHLCYCHTPTHFYWRHYEQYLRNPGFGPFASLGLKLLVKPLRRADYKAAQSVDKYVANSSHIQHDIKQFYGRDSVVIHPPVEAERFKPNKDSDHRKGFITVGRQVPYKRVDLIVQACSELDLPLTVIGRGPDHEKLVKQAGQTVRFLTNASDQEVEAEMTRAEAFILAAFEDFGITPVEAMAAGTPVIAYHAGGALDYVVSGKTGEFFEEQSADSLKQVLKTFDSKRYSAPDISKHAGQFSPEKFQAAMRQAVKDLMA